MSTNLSVIQRITNLIVDSLDFSPEDIKPDTNIRDLASDSLDLVELIISLEIEFNIDIPDEEIDRLITIKDIEEYINNNSDHIGEE